MLSYVIAVAVTLLISIPVTFVVTSAYRKKETETKIGSAEDKAREIIDDAVKAAETKKREGLLEVKEESIRAKNELDKEIKERRAEVQRFERRVQQKEENVDKKSDAIEKKGIRTGSQGRGISKAESRDREAERAESTGTGTNLRINLRTGKRLLIENC